MRSVAVAWVMLAGCAPRLEVPIVTPAPTAPELPVAVAPVVDATVQLQFESPTKLVIRDATTTTHDLVLHDRDGAAALADFGGAHGVMVPLARVIAGTDVRAFRVEATPVCPQPWLVDVTADWIAGQTEIRGTPAVLRAGCGPLQHADFVTAFGPERTLVYGESPFDARMVASELGIVRGDLERVFGVRISDRWQNELVVEPIGQGATPRADASASGLRVHLDATTPWGAEQRLEVGATIARIWLGALLERIAAGENSQVVTPERAALLHGLGRGIARESLFELGLLSPDDYAADLDRAEAIIAERSRVWRPAGVVDARDVAVQAAARSIEAAIVAWELREMPRRPSLPDALRDQARAGPGMDAVGLWASIVDGGSATQLGACIVARKVRGHIIDLGYVTPWDPQRGAAIVSALREGGSAVAAGMKVGDELRQIVTDDRGAMVQVGREGRTLSLSAVAPVRTSMRRGWTRKRNVADDRCYP